MDKGICLCLLITLQLVSGYSESDIFKLPENLISTIFDGFQRTPNESDNIDAAEHYWNESIRIDQWDDELCLQQFNSILDGLNNTELWAIKCECLSFDFSFFILMKKNARVAISLFVAYSRVVKKYSKFIS